MAQFKLTPFVVFALSLSLVSAHGFVGTVTVDGKASKGNFPNSKAVASSIREITDIGPIKGAANTALSCGPGSQTASLEQEAMPGSVIKFGWIGSVDGSTKWPHVAGPLLTYLASCGSTTCDKIDSSTAKWFKIDQSGKQNGVWPEHAGLNAGKPSTVTLPAKLAAGNYLVRNEIIALHLGNTLGGAEFYASCTQLKVGGDQTGVPSASELVTFPGAYKDTDPGIFVPDIFQPTPDSSYIFPGPPVAKLAVGSGSTVAGGTTPAATTSTKVASPSTASTTPTSSTTISSSSTIVPIDTVVISASTAATSTTIPSSTIVPSGTVIPSSTVSSPSSATSITSTGIRCKVRSGALPSNKTRPVRRRTHARTIRNRHSDLGL